MILTFIIGMYEMWQALEIQLSSGTLTVLKKHLAWSYRRFEAVEYPKTDEMLPCPHDGGLLAAC